MAILRAPIEESAMLGRGREANMALAVRSTVLGVGLAAALAWAVSILAEAPASPAPPATPAVAPATMSLAALKLLEPGLWQLDVPGRAPKLSCIADATALVQVEHDQPNCSRFVIANMPKSATVHYSCQRAGWGRTTVRVETPTTAAIQTQGIARNLPFDYSVQAHRVGDCGGATAAKPR